MSGALQPIAADRIGDALRPVATADALPPLRTVIDALGLTAKKSLSQNFILDLNLTGRIARAGGPLAGRTVVEIGPGPGGLTRALLAEGADRVIAIERDHRCAPALAQIQTAYPDRFAPYAGDALDVDWAALDLGDPAKVTIAANLPYAIATKLLTGWLETEPWPPWFGTMVLMFQKEVAERIVAAPNTKAYGRLAVLSQWRCQAHIAFTLPAKAFVPPPKVDSAVVVLTPKADPQPACRAADLSAVTAAAFGQRRKMLRASLKSLTPMAELLLQETGVDPQLRAEALDVATFARLAARYGGRRN
jgi:16S rRNA (adenine1518-N6/adenine1519-N6)-dimethyltransferase